MWMSPDNDSYNEVEMKGKASFLRPRNFFNYLNDFCVFHLLVCLKTCIK